MTDRTHYSSSASDVSVGSLDFPRVKEQMGRLEGQGMDPTHPALWHSNALLAAADLMGLEGGRAVKVNNRASLLVASLLTMGNERAEPVNLEVRHADGTVACLSLGFSPVPDEPVDSSVTPPTKKEPGKTGPRLWVDLESVEKESIGYLVSAFAEATGTKAGGYVSVMGAGAVLAAIQSLESMNAATARFDFEGLGDESHSFEHVGLRLSLQGPSPKMDASPSDDLIERAARVVAKMESWEGWDTNAPTPNGNTPEEQRQWCREVARAIVDVIEPKASEAIAQRDRAVSLLQAYRTAPKFSHDSDAIRKTVVLEDEVDAFLESLSASMESAPVQSRKNKPSR